MDNFPELLVMIFEKRQRLAPYYYCPVEGVRFEPGNNCECIAEGNVTNSPGERCLFLITVLAD